MLVDSLQKKGSFNFAEVNPLVPDERQDKPFSLQNQRLEVDLKLNCGFLFLHPGN